ncbi:hypothetical protein ACP4OV_031067 [Aristida adscensionis]
MGGPPSFAAASTSAARPGTRRRSTRLVGLHRRGDQDHPSSPSAAKSSPDAETGPPPAGDPAPRRSARVPRRVSGRSPSAQRSRQSGTRAARTRGSWIQEKVEEWANEKAASGAPEDECVLLFLQNGAPRKVECLICSKSILSEERMQCSVNNCEVTLHKSCSERSGGCCPRHICFYCKKGTSRHRTQHVMPNCTDCLLRQNRMIDSVDPSKAMICWSIWPSTSEDADPADDIKEAFQRLPLPYADQEFNIDHINKEGLEDGTEPPPYNKWNGSCVDVGCTECDRDSICESCSCRSALTSCSRACNCLGKCSNKPFCREKKIKIVKTEHCGWGAIALETIERGDFVIEFVGEVIDDVVCEERLEDMRQRRDPNSYMCKVRKDFVIDATFRGNASRFFNHSCEPNCQLETWQVKGKTRLGVFATQEIKMGMPLTYNYRYSVLLLVGTKHVSVGLQTAKENCDDI